MEQVRVLNLPPDVAVIDAMRRYARAVARGVGPSKLKDAIPLELLADVLRPPLIEEVHLKPPNECIRPAALFTLGSPPASSWGLVKNSYYKHHHTP